MSSECITLGVSGIKFYLTVCNGKVFEWKEWDPGFKFFLNCKAAFFPVRLNLKNKDMAITISKLSLGELYERKHLTEIISPKGKKEKRS